VPLSPRETELEAELQQAREHILKLKKEVTIQREALERKNKEADALGRVWCDGGCWGGMDRYRDYETPPAVTAEQVAFLLRNARRAHSWYINRAGKEHDDLKKAWNNARNEVALATIEQCEAEIEKLNKRIR
jgi:hypothetical protein